MARKVLVAMSLLLIQIANLAKLEFTLLLLIIISFVCAIDLLVHGVDYRTRVRLG